MTDQNWYRRTTWTPTDQEDFFARLTRSRSNFNKAQYVRIQASYLAGVGTPEMLSASLKLLDLFFQKYAHEAELASAHEQRGDIYLARGDGEAALGEWVQALEAQRQNPNALTMAHLSYAWHVATTGLAEHYNNALKVLDEFSSICLFPKDIYLSFGSRAIIYSDLGRRDEARKASRIALSAASKQSSGFSYHPKAGLVGATNNNVHERLIALAVS